MTLVGSTNSTICLYSDPVDFFSHQARIACYEKDVNFTIQECTPDNLPDIVKYNNPYNTLPTMSDRDLVLYDSQIIIDYLEDRFPHPPLYSVYPTVRAQTRIGLLRIKKELVSPMLQIFDSKNMSISEKELNKIRKRLYDNLIAMAPIFSETEYFMSDSFGILDCYLAPLLWRLNIMGIQLEGRASRPVAHYMNRVFFRDNFIKSCSREERQFMKGIKV